MSLMEDLQSIQNKPYRPIFSGRLITSSKSLVKKNEKNESKNKRLNSTKTTVLMSALTRSSTHVSKTFDTMSFENKSVKSMKSFTTEVEPDQTNISLFSLDTVDADTRINYGNIGHYSPFERFTNRHCGSRLIDNEELIDNVLIHYKNLLRYQKRHGDQLEPNLAELLDSDENWKLSRLNDVLFVSPFIPKAHSIAANLDIKTSERKFISENRTNSKSPTRRFHEKPSRRHSIEILNNMERVYVDVRSESEAKSLARKNSSPLHKLHDLSYNTVINRGVDSPKFHEHTLGFMKKKELFPVDIKKKTNSDRYDSASIKNRYTNKQYKHIQSKLKDYIRPNKKPFYDSPDHDSQRVRSQTAITTHLRTSNDFNDTAPLNMCSRLMRTIKEDLKANKGPIYFGTLTQENLRIFSPKPVSQYEKFLHLFDWLQNLNYDYDEFARYVDVESRMKNISTFSNIASENLNDSISNVTVTNFASPLMDKTPNIFLPKFIMNTKPIQNDIEVTNYNDKMVVNIVKRYRQETAVKNDDRPYSRYTRTDDSANQQQFDSKSKISRTLINPTDNRKLLRKRVQNAKVQNDLLLSRIKLDLYVF